jgi:nucleoside-diphosphate-sugar epimerase
LCEFYSRLNSERKFTVIRHSNIYGPWDKFDLKRSHVFGASITKVLTSKKEIKIWGQGKEKRDLLYVSDLVNFVDLAIKKQPLNFRIYNCGGGGGAFISVLALTEKIANLAGRSYLEILTDSDKPSVQFSATVDCSLAFRELGWSPKVTLEDGIKFSIEHWHREFDGSEVTK